MFESPKNSIPKDTAEMVASYSQSQELSLSKKTVPNEEEAGWSQFVKHKELIEKYRQLFTETDLTVIENTLSLMGNEGYTWDADDSIHNYISPDWPKLSFFGRLFLLHSAESILCNHFDDPDDSSVMSWDIIKHCENNEANFFLKNFALSFTNENHRGRASIERIRSIVSGLWNSSVTYSTETDLIRVPDEFRQVAYEKAIEKSSATKPLDREVFLMEMKKGLPKTSPEGGKITIFKTSYESVWFDRYIKRPEDLTDSECRKINAGLMHDDFIDDLNYHALETAEWAAVHRDSQFEATFLPESIYNNFFNRDWGNVDGDMDRGEDLRFAICKVSRDTYGLYSEDTGEVREYFKEILPTTLPDRTHAREVLRALHNFINSINLSCTHSFKNGEYHYQYYYDGPPYDKVLKMNRWIVEMLPSDISIELKRLYGEYDSSKMIADENEGNEPKDASESLHKAHSNFISNLKDWGRAFLLNRKVSATPLIRILNDKVESKKIMEAEFVHKIFSSMRMREMMEQEFSFSYEKIDLRTQIQFISFLINHPTNYIDAVKQFTAVYGVDGMRAFLSLERGDEELGERIVAFGQYNEIAGTVFKYYGELLDSADRAEELVRKASDCEGDTCATLADQVRENILNRAQRDLESAVRSHNPNEIADQIKTYVATAKEYVALLQEVGTGKIESISSESLTEEEQARMKELLQHNYNKAYPEPENESFKAAVADSLARSFSDQNTTYRILRDEGKIVSFNRFDTLKDYTGHEVSYFGSFNADPAYSGVGGIMLEETIKDRLRDGRPMMAHCDPTQTITKKYIEDGFIATGFYPLAGKPSFEIWRSKNSTRQLESKGKSIEELLPLTENSESIIVREQSSAETYSELQKGMGLTRYFTHQGKTYLVFETLPGTLQDEFIPPQEDLKKAA